MKTLHIFALSAALFTIQACVSHEEDAEQLRSSMMEIQERVNRANNSILVLKSLVSAINANDYITDIQDLQEKGYLISFLHRDALVIYNGINGKDGTDGIDGKDGKDGHNGESAEYGKDGKDGKDGKNGKDGGIPNLGTRMDTDGRWYWTIDGVWVKDDNGRKMPVDGIDGSFPTMRISGGMWQISYDGGNTWATLGEAAGNIDSIFSRISYSNPDYVLFYLRDGGTIRVPRFTSFELSFAQEKFHLDENSTQVIGFGIRGGISNTVNNTVFSTICTGGLSAVCNLTNSTSGSISVTSRKGFKKGKVDIYASWGGYTTIKSLEFTNNE